MTTSHTALALVLALVMASCAPAEPEVSFDLQLLGDPSTVELQTPDARIDVRRSSVPAEFFADEAPPVQFGRAFIDGDRAPGTPPAVVLTAAVWRRLGSQPDLVGATVDLDGTVHVVVGILPSLPELEAVADVLVPR